MQYVAAVWAFEFAFETHWRTGKEAMTRKGRNMEEVSIL